jgi:transcriptional regulator with XRE-family HTH domain
MADESNKRLRLQRRLRGWSQEDVASGLHRLAAKRGEPELGVDATMVSRWERGTRRPRPRYVRLLCNLFELPAEQLGIITPDDLALIPAGRRDAIEEQDVERREFIRKASTLMGVTVIPAIRPDLAGPQPWERLSRALRRPGLVDGETITHLGQITTALESLGPTAVSSQVIFGPVTGHLDAISLLLRGSMPASLRGELCSIAGETACLAGWLRWNMDDPEGAAAYFRAGLEAAREAGDGPLGALLMGSAACQPPYRENPVDRVRKLRGGMFGFTQADASPLTRVWLAAKEADAHALLGDDYACLEALDRAETLLDGADPADPHRERPRFSTIDRTWLEGERGASLAKLGRTHEARVTLEHALTGMGSSRERDRLWLSTSLASTHLQEGEREEACRVAVSVLDRAAKMQLEPVVRVVQDMRVAMGPNGSNAAAIQELDAHLLSSRGAA